MGYFWSAGAKLVTTSDKQKLLMLRIGAGVSANKGTIPHGIKIEAA